MKICPTCRQTYSDDIEFCPRDGAHLTDQATETQAQLAAGLSRRFRIVRRLGEGGMGTVFLAEQIAVGHRPVALKVLLRSLLDNPDFLRRFQEEAASTGRIRHPNVVTIYESGQGDDGTPYIAMEFLEGESLRQALARRGQLPVPEVAEILQQAARGLNAAHKLGIIHRDLKPDNIFLTYPDDLVGEGSALPRVLVGEGSALPLAGRSPSPGVSPREPGGLPYQVKLVDFGIAKLRESATHTQTGMVLGTPAYMSFEQASGMRSDELDARSDIYSLGVVTYEMLTGRVPFQSDTPAGYLRKHLQDAPPPFRAVKPDLPALPQLESVVMKALTKDRNQRYSSALEFARELTSAAQPSPTAQSPATIPPTRIVPPALAKLRHLPVVAESPSRVRFVVLGLVLLGIIAGGIWYLSRSAVQPPAHVRLIPTNGQEQPGNETVDSLASRIKEKYPSYKSVENGELVARVIRKYPVYQDRLSRDELMRLAHGKDTTTQSPGATEPAGQKARTETPLAEFGPTPGLEKVNPKDGLKYVWIPSGTFAMGCSPGDTECGDYEKPPHPITITKSFWLGQTEVTVGAYKRFASATGKAIPTAPDFNPGWRIEQMPIVNVGWDDAKAYCAWTGGRLPTEAEWEYAARAGSTEARYGPIDEVAWYYKNSPGQTHPVGEKRANGFGLYDMLGNVYEWVNDWFGENYYISSPGEDPPGPAIGQFRVLRGGSWGFGPPYIRLSARSAGGRAERDSHVGFRCGGEVFPP